MFSRYYIFFLSLIAFLLSGPQILTEILYFLEFMLESAFNFGEKRTKLGALRSRARRFRACAKTCYADSRRHRVTDTHKVSESTWPARVLSRRVRASGTTASRRQNEARPLHHMRHGEFSRSMARDGQSRLPVAYLTSRYLMWTECHENWRQRK